MVSGLQFGLESEGHTHAHTPVYTHAFTYTDLTLTSGTNNTFTPVPASEVVSSEVQVTEEVPTRGPH